MSAADAEWEPALGGPAPLADPNQAPERIRRLLLGQPYAVLSTQGDGQPYSSLLAFAATADLKQLVFATPTTTRKFALLESCQRVSLLVDNRADQDAMMAIEAVTVTGEAEQLDADDPRYAALRGLYLARHPHLEAFVSTTSVALFVVQVFRCLHVARFQLVHEWRP